MSGRRPLLGVLAAALAGLLAGAAGCGIGPEERATRVDAGDVPFDLLGPQATTPQGAQPGDASSIEVFLVSADGQQLVPARRDAGDGSLNSVVTALADGPTSSEAAAGLYSALPSEDVIVGTRVNDGGVATIDLRSSFRDLSSRNQVLAIAQLVYTATARPDISRVAFTVEGSPTDVPRGDGSLTGGAVSQDAYQSLAPPAG